MVKCCLRMQKLRRDDKDTFSKLLNGEVMEDSRSRVKEYSERRIDRRMCGYIISWRLRKETDEG